MSLCPVGGGGVCLWVQGCVHTPMGTHPLPDGQAGGTHPTGMLSCLFSVFILTSNAFKFPVKM